MSRARMTIAVGLVALTSLFAASTSVAQSPGSPGLGDPYFPLAGNGGYEVDHYDLGLSYSPHKGRLRGLASIDATATQPLSAFDLDLDGMHVRSVSVDGSAAGFAQHHGELVIQPPASIEAGKPFRVSVAYAGRPRTLRVPGQPFGGGWTRTKDGGFAVDEPRGASTWFPCNDHPSDKATFRIAVTVPRHRTAVSNGTLDSVTGTRRSRTYVWTEVEPMTTYLATVAIGRFKIRRSLAGGIGTLVAVDPRLGKGTRRVLRRIPAILRTFAPLFGPYPFSTAGAIVDQDPDFVFTALETQTRPIFPRPFPFGFGSALAHELSHQWFGDAVSLERWSDVWLNEGFATWAQWFWESGGSDAKLRETFEDYYRSKPSESKLFGLPRLWGPVVSPAPKDLFGSAVYFRGGMTLEALRELVGDTTFFSILRDWVARHKYGNATTADFIALAEAESGRSLSNFFDVWLSRPGRPSTW